MMHPLEQKAKAWVEIVTVLQELGLGSPPNISGIEAAITFVRGLAEERDEAKAELAGIRENCYYECVSKKHAQADINRVAKDFGDVADHWRAEAGRLKGTLGSIHAIATDLYRSHDWAGVPLFALTGIERIRDLATEAIEATAVQVTDDDGEAS